MEIHRQLRQRTLPAGQAMRLRAVVLAADGMGPSDIAERQDTSRISVMRWLARFREGGLPALEDRPKSGRPRRYGATYTGDPCYVTVLSGRYTRKSRVERRRSDYLSWCLCS